MKCNGRGDFHRNITWRSHSWWRNVTSRIMRQSSSLLFWGVYRIMKADGGCRWHRGVEDTEGARRLWELDRGAMLRGKDLSLSSWVWPLSSLWSMMSECLHLPAEMDDPTAVLISISSPFLMVVIHMVDEAVTALPQSLPWGCTGTAHPLDTGTYGLRWWWRWNRWWQRWYR